MPTPTPEDFLTGETKRRKELSRDIGVDWNINETGNYTNSTSLLVATRKSTGEQFPLAPDVASGQVGYAQVTANQNGIGTGNTDLTSLSVAVTLAAGRRIRVTGYCQVQNGVVAVNWFAVRIHEGVTQLVEYTVGLGNNGTNQQFGANDPSVILSPSAGSHTYKLTALCATGTCNMLASATSPAYILVEDIGAV